MKKLLILFWVLVSPVFADAQYYMLEFGTNTDFSEETPVLFGEYEGSFDQIDFYLDGPPSSGIFIGSEEIEEGAFSVNLKSDELWESGEHILWAYGVINQSNGGKLSIELDSFEYTVSPQFSAGGILFMVLAWVSIIALNIFTFSKIFKENKEKIVEPLEVDFEEK